MGNTLDISIDNELSELSRASRAMREFLEPRGLDQRALYAVDLMLEEILSNIVKYAYDDGQKHKIQVLVVVADDEVSLTFSDTGKPFNPLAVRQPGRTKPLSERLESGLGIFFTRRMMNDMEYNRDGKKNVLTVRIYM